MSKYFSDRELRCKCGNCDGSNHMDAGFMARLDEVRQEFGQPMIVTSAYRCPEHNAKVSSTGLNGVHTTGKAIDIAVSGVLAHLLLRIAMKKGFTGVGIKQSGAHSGRFIHLDIAPIGGEHYRPTIWSY